MTLTSGGVMTAPKTPGGRGVSTDGAATRKTSTLPIRKGGAASGRLAERPDADTTDLPSLIERAQAGDRDAFAVIYKRYHQPVYVYVARRVTGQATAEDVTSDVFVNALRGLRHVDWLDRDLGAWLFTIAHNAVAGHHRRLQKRPQEVHADLDDVHAPDTTDRSVLSAPLWAAVRRLPDRDRKVIAFRYLLDLPIAQVAVVLGVRECVVKSRTYRALRALRRYLGASIDGDLAPSRRAVPTQPTGSGKVPA